MADTNVPVEAVATGVGAAVRGARAAHARLAFSHGGMVRRGSVLGVLAQAFGAKAVFTIVWLFVGCTLAFGVLASVPVNPVAAGALFSSGSYRLLGVQAGTAAVLVGYALVVTLLVMAVVNRIGPHRVRRRQEGFGPDLSQHGESAYDPVGSADDESTVATPASRTSSTAQGTAQAPAVP